MSSQGITRDTGLRNLLQRRARLNLALNETGSQIDDWVEKEGDGGNSISEIARLEGLLTARKEVLQQLLQLDDELIGHLLTMRAGAQPSRGGSPRPA